MSCALFEPLEARVLMSGNFDYDVDFSTYLGGTSPDKVRAITVDNAGNIYITGSTRTPGTFPTTPGAYDRTFAGIDDVFVAKLDPNGNTIWSTLIGGPNDERGAAIAVDDQGNVYIAGHAGPGFPVTVGAMQPTFQGYWNGSSTGFFKTQNAFVAKLSPDGSQLIYSSYSGTGLAHHSMDVDSNGDIYVAFEYTAGSSPSPPPASWFNGAYQSTPRGGTDTGIMKISSDGSQVLWATYFGGSGDESISSSIRVADNGDAYLMGSTTSADMPTTAGAHDRTLSGSHDFFLARFTAAGSNLAYATYLGGSGDEFVGQNNLAVDSQGNAFVGAWSGTNDYPTTAGAFQTTITGDHDSTVTKFSPTGQLLASTFYGGSGWELITGIDVDAAGRPMITGTTKSANLPLSSDAHQTTLGGTKDAFVAKFSADLTELSYGSYHGGSYLEDSSPAAMDSNGNMYFSGMTWSTDLPIVNAQQPFYGGNRDLFLAKIAETNLAGNTQPIADAGPDQTVQLAQGQTVITLTVDGSGSSDPDGQIVVHRWSGTPDPPDIPAFLVTLGDGTYTFNLEVEDNDGATATDSITLTVLPAPLTPNSPPVAFDDAYNVLEDGVLQINAAAGVLANDNDPDGDPMTADAVIGPLDGTLSLATDGSFIYTPDADFHGTDSFTYRTHDGQANGNTATVTIDVASNGTAWDSDFESGLPPGSGTEGNAQVVDDGTGNSVVQLTEGSDAAFTQLVSLPEDVRALTFDYRFTNAGDGDRIRVSIDGVVLFEQNGSDFVSAQFVSIDSIDLLAFAGQTVQIEFRLSTQGDANSALQVDNVTISSEAHVSVFFQASSSASYLDANGNTVNLSLKGPGTGEIILSPQGLSDAIHIILDGTTDRSTVKLETDGAVTTVGQVTVRNGALKEFKAPDADLLHGFQATGTVTKMSWRDVAPSYTRIDVGGNAQSKAARLNFRSVTDLDLKIDSPVHEFKATQWFRSTATQNRFESGGVRSIKLAGGATDVTWDILGDARSIEIGGPVDGLSLKVTQELNNLRLGDVANASVQVTGSLGSADAWRWLAGSLSARDAKWIRITGDDATGTPGDIGADVTLTGPGIKNNWRALGGTKIAGTITAGTWRLAGPAKKISAGATGPGWSANIIGELRSLVTTIGNLSGTVAATSIKLVNVERDLDNATLLAGADLGDDGLLGGTNGNADTTQAGTFDVLKIGGAMRNSIVGAGWDPVNGVFNDGNDLIAGAAASTFKSIVIGGLLEGVNAVGTGTLPKKLSINSQKLDPEGHPLFLTI